jgi:acetyl esterase/lipase
MTKIDLCGWKPVTLLLLAAMSLALPSCKRFRRPPAAHVDLTQGQTKSLAVARAEWKTHPTSEAHGDDRAPVPPPAELVAVDYPSAVGNLEAYVSPDPKDAKKHPAIIWITGGDCNSLGDVWSDTPVDNDQTARAFRRAGVVTMYPALRGGNDGPGSQEGFYGEVDDVIAAASYLEKVPYVDPARIYLGGHSTGGTLALLVAESTSRFRATFAFGPVSDVRGYGGSFVPLELEEQHEIELRAPGVWLHSVTTPTFVMEGAGRPGRTSNAKSLVAMRKTSKNPQIHFALAEGHDHFSILAPVTALLAQKILADTGPTTNIAVTEAEIARSP